MGTYLYFIVICTILIIQDPMQQDYGGLNRIHQSIRDEEKSYHVVEAKVVQQLPNQGIDILLTYPQLMDNENQEAIDKINEKLYLCAVDKELLAWESPPFKARSYYKIIKADKEKFIIEFVKEKSIRGDSERKTIKISFNMGTGDFTLDRVLKIIPATSTPTSCGIYHKFNHRSPLRLMNLGQIPHKLSCTASRKHY